MLNVSDKWNKYLEFFSKERIDIYFTEEYVKLLENDVDRAECFIYKKNNNVFLFPYLKRKINLHTGIYYDFESPYGYGGPISNTVDINFLNDAQKQFVIYCKENNIIAGFVRFHPLLDNDLFFKEFCKIIPDRQTIAIDLALPKEDIWNSEIHSKHRNVIRKAENSGLKFEIDLNFSYMDNFLLLYNKTMHKVEADKYYYFNNNYYVKLKNDLKNHFLGVVKYDNKIISAAIFLYSKTYGHYHLSGSDDQYLSLYPNNFLLYKTALYLKDMGIKKLHLGGGKTPDINDSLFKFKSRFSKNRFWFKIGKVVINSKVYQTICDEWTNQNPNRNEHYKNILLKYRY